ncbi:MAG: PKD domain-containing protein [Bacteroidota bacterium]
MLKNLFALLVFCLCSFSGVAQVGFPYCESFQTPNTQATTIFGGDARLTEGVLRLTNNQLNQRGHVYLDIPFPSTYGLKAEFEYFSYGGTGQFLADGLTVFFFDGDTPVFNAGGFGGSLGYAPRNQEPGLSNAYMGIGFDEYGGFGNSQEGRTGAFNTLDANGRAADAVVVRGPGNQFSGYAFVVGRRTNMVGADKDGLNPGAQFTISSGGAGTFRVTDPNKPGYRKVFLELQPNTQGPGFFLTLTMQVTTVLNQPRMVTIFDRPYYFPAPKNLKIGFAASTGGSTNFHEIRNLIVQVAADDQLKDPQGIDFSDIASCAGQENQFYITDEEVVLPNENSKIRCLQFYPSLDAIEAESGDICTQARCLEQNRTLVLPEGTFRASDQEGGFTFFPNESFIDKQVTVYYTITDSYGKTSKGNAMTLSIKESPDPITLQVLGQNQVQNNEVSFCKGSELILSGQGNEIYERFEWKKDGVILPGAVQQELRIKEEGVYEVIGYNRKNCPAISNPIRAKWVTYPELTFRAPLVGCTPGQTLDITSALNGYNPSLYDYRLSLGGLALENEALKKVAVSGMYELQVKPKSFTCYSEPVKVEVYIQEKELNVDFDFGVQGTGIKDDTGGGIFPDDVIEFKDLSEDRIVKWEWDFGDSTSSAEKNPTHTYGKKGEFRVTLKGYDSYGCIKSMTKILRITKSYRLMVPNAFTPTQTSNTTFVPKFRGIASLELSIFNLWGELIFRTKELDTKGWDGTLEGKLMDAGFYFYNITGKARDGEKVESQGKFRLIR